MRVSLRACLCFPTANHSQNLDTMARFTSIGMGRKSFVASTAEEGQSKGQTSEKPEEPTAGPSNLTSKVKGSKEKKRPRDADRGQDKKPKREGWSRDDDLASKSARQVHQIEGGKC